MSERKADQEQLNMKWSLDPAHSQIQFAVKHMGISTVRGTFEQFQGTIDEVEGEVKNVEVEVDTASLNTGANARDQHLRGEDFFDVDKYPKARFTLTRFDRRGGDLFAEGNLTIRDTTKPISLKGEIGGPARDPWGNQKVSATLETKISRKEWGLVWNAALETGGVLVSDDVKLSIDVQAAPIAA
jgi:polyisoprenoid-binding protein YceI